MNISLPCDGKMIKLWCYMIRSTKHPEGSQRPPGWPGWRNYTVLFSSCDVKNTKFNYPSLVPLTFLNVSDSRCRKHVKFWMWRHRDMALWRHCGGAWHNGLIPTTDGLTLLTTWWYKIPYWRKNKSISWLMCRSVITLSWPLPSFKFTKLNQFLSHFDV